MTAVLDASALLAFLQAEPGAQSVERQLEGGAICGAANWSEVAQKVRASGRDWDLARSLLLSYGLIVEPVTLDDAEAAAGSWRRGDALSLADRLCLALGARAECTVWTADRAWPKRSGVRFLR